MKKIREQAIGELEQESKYQAAAVVAFVLAKRAQNAGNMSEAVRFGKKCLEIFERYPTDTLEQCASPYISFSDVFIPGLFHEGTVRRELAPLNL